MPNQLIVDQAFVDAINRMAADLKTVMAWQANLKVEGGLYASGPGSPTITIPPGSQGGGVVPNPEFWALINGQQQDGSKKRWFYGWSFAEMSDQTYDDWQTRSGAKSGEKDDDDTRAMNTLEVINGASGMTGSGINIDNLPDGFDLQPIQDKTPVRMRRTVAKNGKVSFWFSAPNGVDGQCTSGDSSDDTGGTP